MATPSKLTVQLSAVTPLFLGGADPNERAELRPASIKGLLRYWFRALDGDYRRNEARYFGSTDTGQSPCLLRVSDWIEGKEEWPYREEKWNRRTGTGYLGFTLNLPPNERRAIAAGERFALEIQPRPGADSPALRRSWLGSLWMLAHVGGIGSRARRGLGSLRIESWEGWTECNQLKLPCQATSAAEWEAFGRDALGNALLLWFPNRPAPDHTTLASKSRFRLLKTPHNSWDAALRQAGELLMRFRENRREPPPDKRQPDYPRIKNALKNHHLTGRMVTAELEEGPVAAGFGLPLAYRYGQWGEITFRGVDHDRAASPLFVRVVKLGDKYHGAFIHLPSPLLPPGEEVAGLDNAGKPLGRWPQAGQAKDVVTRFLDTQVTGQIAVGFNLP